MGKISDVISVVEAFVDSVEELKEGHPNTSYNVGFQLQIGKPGVTDSETLSFLKASLEAFRKFDPNLLAGFQLECAPINPVEKVLQASVDAKQAARKSIVTPKLIGAV